MNKIEPQDGPQRTFLSSGADIAIYGGAAGGGKTFSLLLEAIRHISNPRHGCLIFRRTTKQIREQGGLWDESMDLYSQIQGSYPISSTLKWSFPSGAKVGMSHIEHEKNIYDYQGSQIPVIMFDELTHFTESMFFYLLSRNRSMSGIKGYVRATCNPDPDSWVADFIRWWINQETGFPIEERSGKLRWFVRANDQIYWESSKEELWQRVKNFMTKVEFMPKSVTFIPSKIEDNKILMNKDPAYLASLKALPSVDRARLLDGNWKVRADAGSYFKKPWFEFIEREDLPSDRSIVRYWDRASTEEREGNDPDWTVGLKMSKDKNGTFYIEDVTRFRARPAKVEEAIKNSATQDGNYVTVGIEQDPGQAGKFEVDYYIRLLAGYSIYVNKVSANKETRAKPLSSQAEHGNIKIVRADWNESFLDELESFPKGRKDDQVDAASGAFSFFTSGTQVGKMKVEKKRNSKTIFPSHKSGGQLW